MITEKVTSFIPDAIREAGNTIAAAIQGGSGGSSVEWSQIVTTGTKIATITIDDESTDVYAPTGGGGGSSVSWNEIQTTGTKIAEITIDDTTYDVYAPNVSVSASDVSYDNTDSGLTADDVQEAVDELAGDVSTLSGAVGSKTDQSMIAPVETSTTASQSYAIGEQFILNGTLYTATANISAGGTIEINGNCTASDTVTEQINTIKQGESVSVTTDGVKTLQTLLNELYALIDHTKMSTKATLQYLDYVYVSTYQINGNSYQFVSGTLYNQKFYIQRMTARSGNASGADTYNGTTYTNTSTSVPASGNTITIYY